MMRWISASAFGFLRAWAPFQQFVGETPNASGVRRIDQAGFKLPLDERVWRTPTLCSCSGWIT
jgi:hypothetical protein